MCPDAESYPKFLIISLKFIKKYDTWKMLVKGLYFFEGSLVVQMVKDSPANASDTVGMSSVLGSGGSLEEVMATHSSVLAWEIPWTEGYSSCDPKELDTTEWLIHTLWMNDY